MQFASVLHFLAFADLTFLMIRFGSGAHSWVMATVLAGGPRSRPVMPRSVTASQIDIDPECGTGSETAAAKTSPFQRRVLYFGSQQRRKQFELSPDSNAGPASTASQERRVSLAADLEERRTPVSLFDFEVFKGDEIIATSQSIAVPQPSAMWPQIADFVKNVTEPGCRIRVTNEAREAVINIGIVTARNTAALAAQASPTRPKSSLVTLPAGLESSPASHENPATSTSKEMENHHGRR
jgi:hypothetical protein